MIAITEAFPDGQRVTGAAIAYDEPVRNADVSVDAFQVKGGTVTDAYTNIPDATGGGNHPLICLEQGNGAVNFVRERNQKKYPSFVLSIQYGLEGSLTLRH